VVGIVAMTDRINALPGSDRCHVGLFGSAINHNIDRPARFLKKMKLVHVFWVIWFCLIYSFCRVPVILHEQKPLSKIEVDQLLIE